MEWIVFGDDWGAHPSTTQHLIRHLPPSDVVVWVDSIGMRSPGLNRKDLARLLVKAKQIMGAGRHGVQHGVSAAGAANDRQLHRVMPRIIPWHRSRFAQMLNRRAIARAIGAHASAQEAVVLTATPVAALYLDAIAYRRVAYLRLDDYAALPGVDCALVQETESRLFERCDLVFATARDLLPGAPWSEKGHYLPQGVDHQHFGRNTLEPPGNRVIGFFGLIAEWIDFQLVEVVARRAPDWRFEFLGPARHLPESVRSLPNVHWRGAVPYRELPEAIAGWACAWIPFLVNDLTRAVNPLKLREYLAAGLPAHVTPLPEALAFAGSPGVLISHDPEAILAWMNDMVQGDTVLQREARRARVAQDGWYARALEVRALLMGNAP